MSKNESPKKFTAYKQWWFWVLVGFALLGVFGAITNMDTASNDDDTHIASSKKDSDSDTENDDLDYSSDESDSSDESSDSSDDYSDSSSEDSSDTSDDDDAFSGIEDMPKSERLDAAVNIIKKHFKGLASVEYDEDDDVIKITPDDTSITLGAMQANATGDTEKWDEMTDAIDSMSEAMHENLKISVPIAIINTSNEDRVLYEVLDGSTVYDVTDDE